MLVYRQCKSHEYNYLLYNSRYFLCSVDPPPKKISAGRSTIVDIFWDSLTPWYLCLKGLLYNSRYLSQFIDTDGLLVPPLLYNSRYFCQFIDWTRYCFRTKSSTIVDIHFSSLTRGRLHESSLLYNSRYLCQFIDWYNYPRWDLTLQ